MTPMQAIKAKCLDCCCGAAQEVKLCPAESCPLWAFRFGRNPNIRLSDEERERRAERGREAAANLRNRKEG